MAGWVLVGGATFCLLLFLVSVLQLVVVSGPRGWQLGLLRGVLIVHHAENALSSGLRWSMGSHVGFRWVVDDQTYDFSLGVLAYSHRSSPGGTTTDLGVALWAPTLAGFLAAGSVMLWARRSARPARSGACPTCGYDLAGLGPGKSCPECGKRGVGAGEGAGGTA